MVERRPFAFLHVLAPGPRARQQLRGLVLILLLCGHEVSAVGASFTSAEEGQQATTVESPPLQSSSEMASSRAETDASRRSGNGVAGRGHSDAGRRLTAVGVQFTVDVVDNPTSNLAKVGPSASHVNVHAGVTYKKFTITATSGLGTDISKIKVKLVPYDMAATLSTCATVAAYMGVPFNGVANQIQGAASATANLNEFTNFANGFAFPIGGKFRLCYFASYTWEELTPAINVMGAEVSTNKFWCNRYLLDRQLCDNNPTTLGCECLGKVEGYNWNSGTSVLGPLGLPNPASPAFRAMVTDNSKPCAAIVGGQAFSPPQPFKNKVSVVVNQQGFEIHNMGLAEGAAVLGVWKICYCVAYDQDGGDSHATTVNNIKIPHITPCDLNSPLDFPQLIGTLITVEFLTTHGSNNNVAVYPTLRFSLKLQCGVNGQTTPQAGQAGGCSSANTVRYKIVEKQADNDYMYYDSRAGCKFRTQVVTTIVGSQTVGGHIGPNNCVSAVQCNDVPEVLGPKLPTWDNVQMDASYENNVMTPKDYDICYCDGSCLNSAFWFKAGEFQVRPVYVFMSVDNTGNSIVPNPIVNTMYYVIMKGGTKWVLGPAGSWSTTGSQTREMKILKDQYGIVDKISCLSEAQPNSVSGHRLVNPNTDYTDPSETIKNGAQQPLGQRYGNVYAVPGNAATVAPNIKLLESGWYAVCYCDSNCNQMLNWAVYGRILIAGPNPNQQWTRYVGVSFDLNITGWNLDVGNRLRILSFDDELSDCGTKGQSSYINGPAQVGQMHQMTTDDSLVNMMEYDSRGTKMSFTKLHKLLDGDQIRLTNVNPQDPVKGPQHNLMYNRNHEVFVNCDNATSGCYKILIPVRFPAADFPSLRWDSVSWVRTNLQLYRGMRANTASAEGRGYIVCWSPSGTSNQDFVGQVGKITMKEPIVMTAAALGLTTVMPNVPAGGAPVVVSWTTGDIAKYAQLTGSTQVVITFQKQQLVTGGPYIEVVRPKNFYLQDLGVNVDYDQLGEETQHICGEMFLEMWAGDVSGTMDPNGFPMPKGCYYDEDSVNPNKVLKQLHIVFSPGNGLKRNTKYIVVLNADIKNDLKQDFPQSGAVWIWSMDDVHTNPYGVVELGRGFTSPTSRLPPRDTTGALQLNTPPDGMFEPNTGFRIYRDTAHASYGTRLIELTSYCKAFNTIYPTTTPTTANQCKVCQTEYDCGNGNLATGTAPNALLKWCVSPIDLLCPAAKSSPTGVPLFQVALAAKTGQFIKPNAILRIFLQPLTLWNIGTACFAAMTQCVAPGGVGQCNAPFCETEQVAGGPVIGNPTYPVNVMKVTLPSIMADITPVTLHTIAIGGVPLPEGGLLPQAITAEIMKQGSQSPDYWPLTKLAPNSAKLFKRPVIQSAALVTHPGDGNSMPFKSDQNNIIYIRVVMQAIMWAENGDGITMQFRLPPGYTCVIPQAGLPVPRPLGVVGSSIPSYQGRLGGLQATETRWAREATPFYACKLLFRIHMVLYAYSPIYVAVQVDNPSTALKASDPKNRWSLVVRQTADGIEAPHVNLSTANLPSTLSTGFAGAVPTLGKLSEMVISPTNFGLSNTNRMEVFFKTEQEVGSTADPESQVWVDAPSGFNFQRYCAADHLPDQYYIPEPLSAKTYKLPVSNQLIVCEGAVTNPAQPPGQYNRAKVSTIGRLLRLTTYGFQLTVTNTASYVRSQLNEWKIWTYRKTSQEGVDGAYFTARMNSRLAMTADTSFGCYQKAMPSGALMVSVASLLPTTGTMLPTEITFLPIVVQLSMQRATRIFAPAGYVWDFIQTEFRYKAPNFGVPANQVVQGAEQDLPISGVPASPVAQPKNALTIDYMQSAWIPGVKYGFVAKIRIPLLPPTASANFFSIEFGYSEPLQAGRLEAGTASAPMVQRIINGGITFTTSIKAQQSLITFSMRLITPVPRGGGIFITGPPNFGFQAKCLPKPYRTADPELPYDSTCLFQGNAATGAPEVSITAGPSGIPANFYRFSLQGSNPPQQVLLANAASWMYYTFTVISERIPLDHPTTVAGYSINNKMFNADHVSPPYFPGCYFLTAAQQKTFPNAAVTNCIPEDFQFYTGIGKLPDGGGHRDDRPGASSAIVFLMQLTGNSLTGQKLTVRAPEGYEFNTECKVEVDSTKIFDSKNTNGQLPSGWLSKYAQWPALTTASCYGVDNLAEITLSCGVNICLSSFNRYVFRLEVLRNPMQTPDPNKFILEYNGEASVPFDGINIWAFNDTEILPISTAASTRGSPIKNNVTVYLRPTNNISNGGHLRIEAPAGFIIEQNCWAHVQLHPDDYINVSAIPAGIQRNDVLKYAEFLQGDFICQGDVTVSSRSRLHFTVNNKYIKAGLKYLIILEVVNPQTTTIYNDPWTFTSYRDSTPNEPVDSATVAGFPINDAVQSFAWMTPNSVNALARQILEFNMSFPLQVIIGDMIEIIAPVTFYFSEQGDARCPGYLYLDGNLRKTVPRCGGNTMSWTLTAENVPAGTAIRFLVRVKNPPSTPTLNLFQLRQVSSSGKRKSSRRIPGYAIIPELGNVIVRQRPPTAPCRTLVTVVTQQNCTATGSRGSLEVEFDPTAAGNKVQIRGTIGTTSFDFSGATLPTIQGVTNMFMTIYSRTSTAITANLDVRLGTRAFIIVEGVVHPSTNGVSHFSITTFQGAPLQSTRVDEKLNLQSFSALDYINRRSSSVSPIYYSAVDATITFELEPAMAILAEDVLRITRPPGYVMKDGSLLPFFPLQVKSHGLDLMRRWSTQYANPEDYYAVISVLLPALARPVFTILATLPAIPEAYLYWFFRVYRVEPQRDVDGEILNSNPVPYPWIGRNITATGTNDGAFTGFLLVGQVPFALAPSLRTPGAQIQLQVNFSLAAAVQAVTEVRMEVQGPTGYVFKDSCFSLGSSVFRKCTGYRATATLVSSVNQIQGTQVVIFLAVTNPGQTPTSNTWTLSIYKDASTQYVNWSEVAGYSIQSMPVTYRGNNQLAVSDTAFFKFTPIDPKPNLQTLIVVIIPPPNQGFRLLCTGVKKLSFQSTPICTPGAANANLKLEFSNGTLIKGEAYTLGVGVLNPGGIPAASSNYWGILLQDYQQATFDGDLRVAGLDLKSIPIRAGIMGWKTSAPQVMNTIAMQMRVLHPITAGAITKIVIGAPQYVRLVGSVTTQPTLSLFLGNPFEVSNPPEVTGNIGPMLQINLDETVDVTAAMYTIRFECSNPGQTPRDNTWSLIVMKNIETEYSHYNEGFEPGQLSPYDIGAGVGAANSARRLCGATSFFYSLAGFVLATLVMQTL